MNQLKVEKANVQETSAQLHCQLGELETAAESYKRQAHRLTNENESLIQQMESLEMEMKQKGNETSRKRVVCFYCIFRINTEMLVYCTVSMCVCS